MKKTALILIGLSMFLAMLKTSGLIICTWQVALFPITALLIYLAFLFILKYGKENTPNEEEKK